jgi:hypothetical protein
MKASSGDAWRATSFVQGDAVPGGQVPYRGGAGAADCQAAIAPGFDRCALVAQQLGQAIAFGRADLNLAFGALAHELLRAGVGEQPSRPMTIR